MVGYAGGNSGPVFSWGVVRGATGLPSVPVPQPAAVISRGREAGASNSSALREDAAQQVDVGIEHRLGVRRLRAPQRPGHRDTHGGGVGVVILGMYVAEKMEDFVVSHTVDEMVVRRPSVRLRTLDTASTSERAGGSCMRMAIRLSVSLRRPVVHVVHVEAMDLASVPRKRAGAPESLLVLVPTRPHPLGKITSPRIRYPSWSSILQESDGSESTTSASVPTSGSC